MPLPSFAVPLGRTTFVHPMVLPLMAAVPKDGGLQGGGLVFCGHSFEEKGEGEALFFMFLFDGWGGGKMNIFRNSRWMSKNGLQNKYFL